MNPFNVVICDITTPQPYELQTLGVQALGGTEATVIRVAEGLGSLGLRVAVVQHNLNMPLMGKHAYYLPLRMLNDIECHNYIALRGCQYMEKFPNATKFSWHEDVPNEVMLGLKSKILEHDVTVVGASQWHKVAIQELICNANDTINPRVTYVYNPVPDSLYVPRSTTVKYNPDKLVWPASPHKGLGRAIDLVRRTIEVSGNKKLKLHIFNPGYFSKDFTPPPFVVNHGPVPCADLWQHVSEALCVFYPTTFKETFGCIAAEANAVHTPVLTHPIAALAETVAGNRQFVENNDSKIIDRLLQWHAGERPEVYGQERFKLSNVLKEWMEILR